jgi:hypothetical protein
MSSLLGDDLFQPAIFVLKRFQPLHLTEFHPAELALPAVVRLLGDPVRAAQVGHLPAGFAFANDLENLLVGEFAPLHRSSRVRRTLILRGAD